MFKNFILSLAVSTLYSSLAFAQMSAKEFKASQLSFDYLSSDGSFWYDCSHEKAKEAHDWIVNCDNYKFNLHILLYEHRRADESTFEFHYWADEVTTIKENHTQSTWLTIDKAAHTKSVKAYLGFKGDAGQLRLELKIK